MGCGKHRVLYLMPGPKFDLEWEFGVRLQGLSRFSEGYLVALGQPARSLRIGDYDVITTFFWPESALSVARSRFVYLKQCIKTMLDARRAGRPIEIVIAYDPLLTGAIGWMLAAAFRVKLICEVNGDYRDGVNFMHVKSRWLRAVKQWAACALARFIVSRSAGIRKLHPDQLRNLGYRAKPGQVVAQIPEFVNTKAFTDLGEEKVVLLVGFPFFVKGVDIAIAAFRSASAKHPEWQLKIMGYYPDRAELDQAIGTARNITHQIPVIHRHMPEHIGRCGIVLQPSRTEAMGRVLVEAMAAGKPRIASNVGGIPTVIAGGVDGILVESEDVDGFARALDQLMGSAELRQRLGKAAAVRAAAEFSPDNYFEKLERLLGDVAAGG